MPPRVIRTEQFDQSARWLAQRHPKLLEELAAAVRYLGLKGRDASLPLVRFGLAQSRYSEIAGELRCHIPGDHEFVRALFILPDSGELLFLAVLGDKAASGDVAEWYTDAIRRLDDAWEAFLQQNPS